MRCQIKRTPAPASRFEKLMRAKELHCGKTSIFSFLAQVGFALFWTEFWRHVPYAASTG